MHHTFRRAAGVAVLGLLLSTNTWAEPPTDKPPAPPPTPPDCAGEVLGEGPDALRQLTISRMALLLGRVEIHVLRKEAPPSDLASMVPKCPGLLKDAWGNAFVYTVEGNAFTLASSGPDGKPGTEDDITPPK